MRKLLFVSLLLNLAACASVSVMRFDFTPYPARRASAVTIMRTAPADREYRELASFAASSSQDGLDSIREEAGMMGCDAIILGRSEATGVWFNRNVVTGQVLGASNTYSISAIGIRYIKRPSYELPYEAPPPPPTVTCHYDMQCPSGMTCDIGTGTCTSN